MEFAPEGTLTLTKAEATALATFASTDSTRPQLGGVWIEPEMLRAWATDGSRAVMARRVGGMFLGRAAPVMVPRDTLLGAIRMCRKGTDRVVIYVGGPRGSDDGSRVLGAGAVVGLQAVDEHGAVRGSTHAQIDPTAKPLTIDKVVYVPERPTAPGSQFGVNAQLLAESISAVSRAAAKDGVTVTPGAEPTAPIGLRVEADNATEWTAVVMPFRTGAAHEIDVDAAVAWAASKVEDKYGKAASTAFSKAAAAAKALPAEGESTDTEEPPAPKRRGGGRRRKAA